MQTKFRTKIHGVSHGDRQKVIKKYLKPDQPLLLVREPRNKIDPNAIAVYLERKTFLGKKRHHLGYLSEERAQIIAPALDAGWAHRVTVMDVTGGTADKPTLGVNIYIQLLEPAP